MSLEQLTILKDDLEQEIDLWQPLYVVWANIEPLSGKEYFKARQTKSDSHVQVTIRYKRGVTPQMRVLFNDQSYEIVSVINVNMENKYLQLICKEGESLGEFRTRNSKNT